MFNGKISRVTSWEPGISPHISPEAWSGKSVPPTTKVWLKAYKKNRMDFFAKKNAFDMY